MRTDIDEHINACFVNRNLSSIKGSPEEGTLVLAPFYEQNNSQPTYHRALIIKPSIRVDDGPRDVEYCFVRFVDYGNYKEVPQQALKFIEDECLYIPRSNMVIHIAKIPFLAVKYRLV